MNSGSSPSSIDVATNVRPAQREKQSLDYPEWTVGTAGNLYRYHRNHRINIYLGPVGFYWCVYASTLATTNQFQMRNATGDWREVFRSSRSYNSEAECVSAVAEHLETVLRQLEEQMKKP
jgi:hypothetical protein